MWTPFIARERKSRQRKSSPRKASRRTMVPRLEQLEDRLALATFTVTTTDDGVIAPAVGTLRAAILLANLTPEHDTINFGVSGTISPLAALPPITNPVTIDGVGRSITLNGSNAGALTGPLDPGVHGLGINGERLCGAQSERHRF